MPSNSKTTYLNLRLFSLQDGNTSFNDWWKSINLEADGSQVDYSAFQILDAAYHDLDERINNLPSQIADLFDAAMEHEY